MNKENCALNLVDEIILYYDARSKKDQIYAVPSKESSNTDTEGTKFCSVTQVAH